MRKIYEVAFDIKHEWKQPYFGAVPYIEAMLELDTKTSKFGVDDAENIVLYFLANAATFRGEKARALKQELKSIVGVK